MSQFVPGDAKGESSGLDVRGLPAGYPYRPEWEVTPREVRTVLAEMRGDGAAWGGAVGAVLVDCRQPDEYQVCRIEGAVLIPLGELERRADELEDEESGRNRVVVVYCHAGRRSMKAATMLRALGFGRAVSMAGGIDLWSVDIDPRVPRY